MPHRDPPVSGHKHGAVRAAVDERAELRGDVSGHDRGGGSVTLGLAQGDLAVAEVDVGDVQGQRRPDPDAGAEQQLDEHPVSGRLETGRRSEHIE